MFLSRIVGTGILFGWSALKLIKTIISSQNCFIPVTLDFVSHNARKITFISLSLSLSLPVPQSFTIYHNHAPPPSSCRLHYYIVVLLSSSSFPVSLSSHRHVLSAALLVQPCRPPRATPPLPLPTLCRRAAFLLLFPQKPPCTAITHQRVVLLLQHTNVPALAIITVIYHHFNHHHNCRTSSTIDLYRSTTTIFILPPLSSNIVSITILFQSMNVCMWIIYECVYKYHSSIECVLILNLWRICKCLYKYYSRICWVLC